MNLGEQFRCNVVTVDPANSIKQATLKMHEEDVGAVVVVEDRKVAGILTDRDVARAVVVDGIDTATPVRQIMTQKVVTIWEDQGVLNATQYFRNYSVRRLPIINRDNELVGIVTLDDVMALLGREIFYATRVVASDLADKATP